MMAQQLALDLQPRRLAPRERPVIERLRAVLTRMGIAWGYRELRGSVLLRPLLGVRFGWQSMCGYFGCGQTTFERAGYLDRPPLTPEERHEHQSWLAQKRECVYELWGRP